MLTHFLKITLVLLTINSSTKAQNIDTNSSFLEKEWAVDKGYWGGKTIVLTKKMNNLDTSKISPKFLETWTFLDKYSETIIFKKDGKIKFHEFIDCPVGEDIQYFSEFEIKEKYLQIQHKIINWEDIDKYRKEIPDETEMFGYRYEFNIPYDTLKYRIDFISDKLIFLSLWNYQGKKESPNTYKTKFHRYKEEFEPLLNKKNND